MIGYLARLRDNKGVDSPFFFVYNTCAKRKKIMAKNSFQKLAEFYGECVDKEDEKGFAEHMKKQLTFYLKELRMNLI